MTQENQRKPWDLIALIGIVLAVITLIFGDNLYERYTGKSIFDALRSPTPQVDALLYDDFNNSAFDGKYNPNLWSYDATKHVEMKQQNGVLTLITTSIGEEGSNALVADSKSWILQDLELMEAKLKLDSIRKGQGSFVKIQAVAWEDELPYFIECQLGNSEIDHTSYFCNYQAREWSTTEDWTYEYETEIIEGKYDTSYVARFEVDPKTLKIQFFLDDKLIGSHTPKDADILRKARFYPLVGSWAGPDDQFIGYIDDVRIGK